MPLDAIAIRATANELGRLAGFKIDKIQQPERDMVVLALRAPGESVRLLVSANSANPRLHLTESRFENPATPPMFCMLLRKMLQGGKIAAVRQLGLERIIDIEIETYTELGDPTRRHLLCELMGRNSNLIFLDEDMKIIDSVKHTDLSSGVRSVLPGLKYVMPPWGDRLDPLSASAADFMAVLDSAEDGLPADKAIASAVGGISPLLARECLFEACGDGNRKIGEISPNVKQKTALALERLFKRVADGSFEPCLLIKDGAPADFAPFMIRQYGELMEARASDSMNAAAEDFYLLRDRDARMKSHAASLLKTVNNNLARATKKMGFLENDLRSAKDRDKFRVWGDLLTANLYMVEKGAKSVTVVNYYDENQANITIPLDESKSPSQNAKAYYNRYKKAKNTEIHAAQQMEITKAEIEYLESVQLELEQASSLKELADIRHELAAEGYVRGESGKKGSKQPVALAPMEFEVDGYTVMVGRNNVQNDHLTLKIGRSRDLWLHTKNIAGSHTLIKFQGEDFPPEVITKAAGLAAYFSKARNAPKAEVDYCPVSHVKKPRHAKAGMVIYEGYSTALVRPISPEELLKE